MQLLTLISGIAAVASLVTAQSTGPKVPSQDSFYNQPANISSYNNGAIIRGRALGNQIQGLVSPVNVQVGAVYEYMYRTTDSMGNAVASVMTYLVPQKPDNTKLLSFSIEYDSANIDASPSYSIQPGANHSIGYDVIFIQAALNNGWHVVTADYEGLKAQFTAGIQSGHAAIDSIRASLNATVRASTNLSSTAKYAFYGYSGGSIAAEWGSEFAPSYATDLPNLVGTAVGGVLPNLTNILLTINNSTGAGVVFAAAYGLSKAYTNLSAEFNKTLIPSKAAQFYSIGGAVSPLGPGMNQDLFSYFTPGKAILNDTIVKSVLLDGGQMGRHGVPKVPLFFYKAQADEVSPVVDTDKLAAQYCSQGVTLDYQRNTFGGHFTEAVLGTPAAFAWLKDRFNGVPVNHTGCSITNVTVTNVADSGADAQFGNALAAILQTTLGNPNFTFQFGNNTNATMFF